MGINIIEEYINKYNKFDIKGMLELLDKDISFINYCNDEIDFQVKGLEEFERLARTSIEFFETRTQKIINAIYSDVAVAIEVTYLAVPKVDLPNGIKKGQVVEIEGKSFFRIKNRKISEIIDVG